MVQKIRIDKWLWAVRIFKTRTKASKACDEGKVKILDEKIKSSYKLSINEIVNVRVNYQYRTFKVLKIIEKRVGAVLAAECFEDLTPPEELEKMNLKSVFLPSAFRKRGDGRPTKKDRREIDKHHEDFLGEIENE